LVTLYYQLIISDIRSLRSVSDTIYEEHGNVTTFCDVKTFA